MKTLFLCCLFGCFSALAQVPVFTDFVKGSVQLKNGQLEFYLENISDCLLEQIQLRVATDQSYQTILETTFITQLQPKTSGAFMMQHTAPLGKGLSWTIDSVTLAQPLEGAMCKRVGLVAFEKYDFAGVARATLASLVTDVTINRAAVREYTIVAGDSWWKIADRFSTTPEEVAHLNGRDLNTLSIGEIIKVPAPDPAVLAVNEENLQGVKTYTVKVGDTLFSIARAFSTSVERIRQANCLAADEILNVNQNLRIPVAEVMLTNQCR
ncbi:MAG: LysM peptidoglycan-binding domain-containing protein [Trueperaceae bacterium]